ncbi:GTPase Der [uncultured delta proteobacterium]|uniref:GTPase Der n=1 Tax=uncultured delta proteobacterium TaxID=34034 RepID=A0A212KDY2_9DELT|nr:GTPase Der [uncultured delta proteobacterium]
MQKRVPFQPMPAGTPKIALVGRPNVGKSTLFNRLIRSKRAITHDMPGITRDRMEGVVRGKDKQSFVIIDTGGVTLDAHEAVAEGPAGIRGFEEEILRQTRAAIEESVALVLVVDAREGVTPFDEHVAAYIRKSGKPALVAVNKVDGPENAETLMADFYALGLPLLPCSAEHGFNVRALEEEMREFLPEPDFLPGEDDFEMETDDEAVADGDENEGKAEDEDENAPLRLAFLGRPNAGKSSLVNALAKTDRMIVSDIAGTTRDSVDVSVEIGGAVITFVDTAGVRRRAKVTDTVERYSVNSSIKSTTKAHVTLLVVDGPGGLAQQDKRLIDMLSERMTPFMVLVNKCDLMSPAATKEVEKAYKEALVFCPHVPLLFVSAVNGKNLKKIIPLAREIRRECAVRIPTGELNRAFEAILTAHQPPLVKGARAKFYYMTQAETKPPTFVFFVNHEDRVLPSYARYMEKSLRKTFGITSAPIRVHFRSTHTKKKKK